MKEVLTWIGYLDQFVVNSNLKLVHFSSLQVFVLKKCEICCLRSVGVLTVHPYFSVVITVMTIQIIPSSSHIL